MPSILVHERLMAEPLLTGAVPVPAEGSVLPESYDFERGETRAAVVARMQRAMKDTLAELWPRRAPGIAVSTPEEAVILASIVEKETGKASERRMVAGVLSNRLRIGMMLGADATAIYPITKGKPLGRLIRRSELRDPNPYNTRAIAGLPAGPITNPGRESLAAVLDPAKTDALYYVADGTGGTSSRARWKSTTPMSRNGGQSAAAGAKCSAKGRLTARRGRPKCAASPALRRGDMPLGRSSSAG